MGELIKVIKQVRLDLVFDGVVDIELNHPLGKEGKKVVHVQTSQGRLEFTEDAFVHLLATVLDAEDKLKQLKQVGK